MLSNLLTAVGLILLGVVLAHLSPWLALTGSALVFLATGAALGRNS